MTLILLLTRNHSFQTNWYQRVMPMHVRVDHMQAFGSLNFSSGRKPTKKPKITTNGNANLNMKAHICMHAQII